MNCCKHCGRIGMSDCGCPGAREEHRKWSEAKDADANPYGGSFVHAGTLTPHRPVRIVHT